MNKKILASAIVIILLMSISFIGGNTFARYTSKRTVNAYYEVAKWSVDQDFLVNGSSVITEPVNLVNTYTNSTLADGKIAPGTSGNFSIVIDTTGTEVALDYEVRFNVTSGEKPANLLFKYNGKTYTEFYELENDLMGYMPINEKNRCVIDQIDWVWDYQTSDEGDIQDTVDGENISDFAFDVSIICTQAIPQEWLIQ